MFKYRLQDIYTPVNRFGTFSGVPDSFFGLRRSKKDRGKKASENDNTDKKAII